MKVQDYWSYSLKLNFFIFNQLLKAWRAYVASTCSSDAVDLVAGLGADLVVDYSAVDAKEELKRSGG